MLLSLSLPDIPLFRTKHNMTKSFDNWALGAPTPSTGELETMRGNMGELMEILSWARPHGSEAELEFLKTFLLPRLRDLGANPQIDGFGNIWAEVSPGLTAPRCSPVILWSCHVDTVHAKGGRQAVRFADRDGRTVELVKAKPGRCLGADDGAGVWLMLEMVRAGVAGGYVFHRGEEKGRLGSEWALANEPERLSPYDACVAFDRRDFRDLITHQMGMRCASDAFAETLSYALNASGRGLAYRADSGGSYTDSYTYADVISECCNVSVGYDSEHGPRETLDALHLWRLREAACSADFSMLICERDPSVVEYDDWGFSSPYSSNWGQVSKVATMGAPSANEAARSEREALIDLIDRFPAAAADLLLGYGLGTSELLDNLTAVELGEALACGGGTGWAEGVI